MKRNRIKSDQCLNCHQPLVVYDNFCPNCGQENDNKRQSFSRVMRDLVEGFLSVDSRLANSIPALLFKPGFLTIQYLAGKRSRYLDPIRMFLTIIVTYFLINSYGDAPIVNEPGNFVINKTDSVTLSELRDTVNNVIETRLDSATNPNPQNDVIYTQSELDIEGLRYDEVKVHVKKGVADTDQMLDSLKMEHTFWNRFVYSELIKFATSDFDKFITYLVSKMPWLVFMMMPVFALLLKLFYFRRSVLYIDHLIFAFNLHSFIFLIGIIHTLLTEYTAMDPSKLFSYAAIFYTVFSLKNVYSQSWLKTILKFHVMLVMYFFTSMIFLFISLVIVFLIY